MYYFYVLDADFGPGFIKICTYFPYPAKVWLNGHEWAKRQARRAGIVFSRARERLRLLCRPGWPPSDLRPLLPCRHRELLRPLDQGDPDAVHQTPTRRPATSSSSPCARSRSPAPSSSTTLAEPEASSSRSCKTTSASAAPMRSTPSSGATSRGRTTAQPFATRVFSAGTEVKMDFRYKHSRVKQYLKEGRALRIETVINKPSDIGVLARLEHLGELVDKARQVNDRLLMIERAGQGCAIGSALFERIHQPYVREGQRTGAFRFGDQRAMALAGSLCLVVHAVTGFTNKSLRGQVAGLLGKDYSSSQMSYDLRRLRLHGLIARQAGNQLLHPHARWHPRRCLLHQVAGSPASPAPRGRQTSCASRASSRPGHRRARTGRLRHERPPWSRRLKLVTKSRGWWTKKI